MRSSCGLAGGVVSVAVASVGANEREAGFVEIGNAREGGLQAIDGFRHAAGVERHQAEIGGDDGVAGLDAIGGDQRAARGIGAARGGEAFREAEMRIGGRDGGGNRGFEMRNRGRAVAGFLQRERQAHPHLAVLRIVADDAFERGAEGGTVQFAGCHLADARGELDAILRIGTVLRRNVIAPVAAVAPAPPVFAPT